MQKLCHMCVTDWKYQSQSRAWKKPEICDTLDNFLKVWADCEIQLRDQPLEKPNFLWHPCLTLVNVNPLCPSTDSILTPLDIPRTTIFIITAEINVLFRRSLKWKIVLSQNACYDLKRFSFHKLNWPVSITPRKSNLNSETDQSRRATMWLYSWMIWSLLVNSYVLEKLVSSLKSTYVTNT